jgi:tRNA dimethylallyltransferase
MNNSDRNNPRRLVRAIEIAQSNYKKKMVDSSPIYDYMMIGLRTDMKILEGRIQKRVTARVDQGIINEIKSLLSKGFDFSLSSFSSCGYGVWKKYIETNPVDKSIYQHCINNWVLEETQYAKRQMTFFRKMKDIEWFDSNTKKYELEIGHKVQKWYNLNNATL